MTTAVVISAGERRDLPAIVGLLSAAALPVTGAEDASLFVARRDEAIVGCAGLETYGRHGLLRSVAVAEHCRGQGIARRLVEEVVEQAGSAGLTELYLLTTSAPEFFQRLGFAAFRRNHAPAGIAGSWEFRVGCPDTAVSMWRRLSIGKSRMAQ